MVQLRHVPQEEFHRARALPLTAEARAGLFADMCRVNTLYMIKRAGSGHIGSSFGSLDIVSWLYLNELREHDIYYSSKGHDAPGLYAVLTALGRVPFEGIHQLRRLHGLPGHPDIATPGIAANTGSLGMGVSKAKGMVAAHRSRGENARVFVLTGDGELQEGQFWESLPQAAHRKMGEITVIVDHNKVQSDTWVSRVNDLGDLAAKFSAFGWHVARCGGHDIPAFARTLRELAGITDKPKVIIADTVKGKGVSFMEHTAMHADQRRYLYHSGAPDDAAYARAADEMIARIDACLRMAGAGPLVLEEVEHHSTPVPSGAQRLIPAYARALIAEAERDARIVALDADLAFDTGLLEFEERFPQRFIECGIAEQDMVSQAGAMALRGLLPAVHSFACFLSARPNEQIYNNASEGTRVVYVSSLAGLLPAGPGHSHQAVRDIAALAAVPGLTMLEPCCVDEVAHAVRYCFREAAGSTYLRLVSIPCEAPFQLPENYRLREGCGTVLREGDAAVLIAYGPVMLAEAWSAARMVEERTGFRIRIINLPWLNRIDPRWLAQTVEGCGWLFTLDDHALDGGQGERIAAMIATLNLNDPPRIKSYGVRGIPPCGQNGEALRAQGLDAASLADDMLAHLARSGIAGEEAA